MKLKFRKLAYQFFIALSVCLAVFLHTCLLYAQDNFLSAKVKDISDRAYELAVIKLLDGAKESIVMSMYSISLGTEGNNPVKLLLNDLLEARDRGVSVTIYLNTRFKRGEKDNTRITESPVVKTLEDAGCIVHFIKFHQRLHDKLIIVDGRYVVEASTNWSISALRDNYESGTLIDSKDLAKIKLARVKSFILPEKKPAIKPDRELYTKNLPKEISIPEGLVTDKRFLAKMLNRHATYTMDLYLTLVAYSQSINKRDFFIDMESMALSMGMPESCNNSTLRRQVIKNLRDLKNRYKLINVKFFRNKDAWVELINTSGETFTIPSEIILDKENSLKVKYYLIAQALLETQGEDINAMSSRDIEKRLPVSDSTIDRAREEMRE